MTKRLEIRFEIKSWDEKTYREFEDGRKFTTADVALKASADDIDADATYEGLMYYAADGTSTYVGLMQVTGTLNGQQGSFVLKGEGTYDGTTARIVSTVVIDSGTEELSGITGESECVSTHADYPFWPMTLTYSVE
jgi:hypothetical protein